MRHPSHLVSCIRTGMLIGIAVSMVSLPLRAGDVRPFLEEHCIGCHGEDKAKAGLRLDTLPFEPGKPENAGRWEEVFTRVRDHEMPPPKKAQPGEKARAAFTGEIRKALLTSAEKQRAADGRVVLRRLNREEYQNTLRDMLGVEVDLKGFLPEDTTALGFDNIGEALSVSSVLMERYLVAADAALDAVLVKGPRPETKTWHLTMEPNNIRKPETNNGKWDYRLASGVRVLEDGTYIFFNSGFQPMRLEKFQAPLEGNYRFRVTSYAVQSGGKPLTLEIFGGSFDTRSLNTRLVGLYDVPEDQPTVIEFVEHLPLKGSIRPFPYRLGQHNLATQELVDAYKGPGIAVRSVDIEGPLIKDWPPVGCQRLLGDVELAKGTLADAERALRWLAPRAFRRPVVEEDVQPYIKLVQAAMDAGKPFEEALRGGIKGMLCSPDFLFMRERAGALGDHDLATRLSYFLWSSAPDEELAGLAARGALHEASVLRGQVERMLKDERSMRFVENFTGQWLGLRNIEFTTPDKKLYPEHDDALQDAMLKETRLFFTELLVKDLSVANLVDSEFTFLNERLARHYGIEGIEGQGFRKVALTPEMHRGGVLTQAAVLKVTANGTNTSPVIRGNWVLKNIVGRPVKPPPPNVPAIEPDIRGAKTMREQVALHRERESCAGCHDRMDPPGLALENYDVIGGWRTSYRTAGNGEVVKLEIEGRRVQYKSGLPVDASGALPDGRTFEGLAELKKHLLADRAQIARCVTGKLLTYATGAGPDFADRVEMDELVSSAGKSNHGLRTLVHLVVQSRAFQHK